MNVSDIGAVGVANAEEVIIVTGITAGVTACGAEARVVEAVVAEAAAGTLLGAVTTVGAATFAVLTVIGEAVGGAVTIGVWIVGPVGSDVGVVGAISAQVVVAICPSFDTTFNSAPDANLALGTATKTFGVHTPPDIYERILTPFAFTVELVTGILFSVYDSGWSPPAGEP